MGDIEMASGQGTTSDSTSDPPVLSNTRTQLDEELVAHDSGYQVSHNSLHQKVSRGCTHQAYNLSRARDGYPADA